ncbi:hypothetical protein MPTA5024_15915, partial [Microbispora sp. ATCC PTA-5024]
PAETTPAATDETWPDAPSDDFDAPSPGPRPPFPAASAPVSSPGIAAARDAARAAAQSGPRPAWPDAVPRRRASDVDDVDPLNDADADVSELTGMALIQRELGGRVIEEIDHS